MFARWKCKQQTHTSITASPKNEHGRLYMCFCEDKKLEKDNMLQDGSPMIVVHGVMGPRGVIFIPISGVLGRPYLENRAFP